jgi:hypothetical protein
VIFDLRTKLLAGGLTAALLLAGVAFTSWLSAHDAMVQAEATVEAQREAFARAGEQIRTMQEADAERAREAAAQIDAERARAARAVTPAQIAQYVSEAIARSAPAGSGQPPFQINIPPATPENPAPAATIAPESLPQFREYVSLCEECKVARAAAEQDVTSKQEQLRLAGEQLAAVQKERDAWRVASRGTFWGRVKSAMITQASLGSAFRRSVLKPLLHIGGPPGDRVLADAQRTWESALLDPIVKSHAIPNHAEFDQVVKAV